jgi:hypothetical protein
VSPGSAPARSSSVPPACSIAPPPQPGTAPSPEWRDRWPLTGAGRRGRLTALPPPFDRNHRPPFLSTAPAPDPLFEIEHLGLRAKPEAQEELRREHRDMVAAGAIDLDEITLPEILDPRGVERKHWRAPCSWSVPAKQMGRAASMVDVAIPFQARRDGRRARGPQFAPKPSRFHSSRQPALRRPSSTWAWSSGRTPGRRPRISASTCAGAIAIACSSASFASAVRPSWPSAAASTR